MKTIEEIANSHGGLPVPFKTKDGIEIGGVVVGKKLGEGVFAEEVASCRYVIRSSIGSDYPRRMGEVMGSNQRFQAMLMDGTHVGVERSVKAAAGLLLKARGVRP